MKHLFYLTVLVATSSNQLTSQNLFPNPDFETRDSCPYDVNQIKFCKPWVDASGSVDYFNCGYAGSVVTTFPNSGTGYLSMLAGKIATPSWVTYTENPKTKLTTPLIKGRQYKLSFNVGYDVISEPDSLLDFGFYFYSKSLPSKLSIDLGCRSNIRPQVSINCSQLLKNRYRDFSICFKAEANYDSVMVGPFCNSYSVNMPNSPASNWYFMLDDIELRIVDTADFTADKKIFCDSSFVNFSITKPNATEFLWKFPGAEPDSIFNYGLRPIRYNKSGKYDVILISYGICQDTVIKKNFIEVIASGEKIDLIQDDNIIICKSENTIIRTLKNRKVLWSNGLLSDSLKVNTSGMYTCKFYTGCDTIYDTAYVQFYPKIEFKADKTNFCDSGVVNFSIINPTNSFTCFWLLDGGIPKTSNSESPQNIQYRTGGNFDVKLIVDRPCPDTITKSNFIQVIKKLSDRNLVEPSYIEKCDYETIEVKTKNNVSVQWINGQVSPSIQITKEGTYTCSYINFCDTIVDSFLVTFRAECPCEVFLPNSFSPNNDQLNDHFSLNGYAENLRLNIYNRVGEKVFSSTDNNFRWDGKYKGEMVSSGVFIYTLSYTNCLKQEKFKSGSMNILY